ncbi:hypothetical protein B0H21DRAFT_800355 [Amylocystis lapponica]|nr:hypothetical protein B0H21DRAFT_800355 [Amylocystis lapponica]
MATFSPSPAPRRTTRRATSHGQSPPAQPARRRAGGSKPPSRFTTPTRRPGSERLQSVADDESFGTGMDLDEGSDVFERASKAEPVFAKSREMEASFYAYLPVEVKQVLKNADFYRDAYTGDVDPSTGYALVASRETCFVWKFAQALSGTPTCYIFTCPVDEYPTVMVTPFHALVPYGQSREPGLILSSTAGQIRFWDSLGMGLAGADNFSFLSLNLEDEECVTTLTRADPQTYIVSTSAGRLFRLIATATGGKYHLTARVFSRPQSTLSLSRLLPSFWSNSELQSESGNINAVTLETQVPGATSRNLWAIADMKLQKWNMSAEGWEELLLAEDVSEITRDALREVFLSASENDMELDLELLDLKLGGPETMVILVSFAGPEDTSAMDVGSNPRRIYAVVSMLYKSGEFQITGVRSVPYQSTTSSGAPMHPRMQLMSYGKLVAIQFGDAVTLCARDTDYNDRLELKSATDRTLGIGLVDGESELLVLTAATMMRAYIDIDAVSSFDPETGRAHLIKGTMVQAIQYGSYPDNPLQFSFPPEVDGQALMDGAEQLSWSILVSDPDVVRPHHDLQAQIISRREKMSFLIKFIGDNGVLHKMSRKCRQRLAVNSEKLYAAHQLWIKYNQVLGVGHAPNVLSIAVHDYMVAINEASHDDYVRAFFRNRVEDIDGLFRLDTLTNIIMRATTEHGHNLADIIAQVNLITLTIVQSALSFRNYNKDVYGLQFPLFDPWSSGEHVIATLSTLFDYTTQLVETPSPDPELARLNDEPKAQLPELAASLFACYQERLDWLSSPLASEQTGSARERSELEDRFKQLRPEVLETLRRDGFAGEAFGLAEKYRDFRSLASLCHKDTVYPPQNNPHAARIEAYIGRFKDAFTTELYQWYIEHGELRTLFAREHDDYLDRFFAEHPDSPILWLHELGRGRYGPASESLLHEADRAGELVSKHLMLSIGKLSQLAQLHENKPIDQTVLDAFHDGLDFVDVHETLLEDLKSALATVRSRQSLEMQLDTITRIKGSNLAHRRALQSVFKQLVRQLLQGKALSVEDMADVLSLKDNTGSVEDYATALQLLAGAQNIPSARRLSAFRNIWRRIYIHDDWDAIQQTANVTDAELNERLRDTALYVALQATLPRRHKPDGYISLPSEALAIPERSEITLRWPGMWPEEVDAVRQDHLRDAELLESLHLDNMYESLRQLIEDEQ